MIRLVASDLDLTMVPEGTFDLNPEYYDVIRALRRRGILFAAASGRHYTSIVKLMHPVKDEIAYLGGNGSCVVLDGELIESFEIRMQTYQELLQQMRVYEPKIIVTDHPDCVYSDTEDEEMFQWMLNGYRVDLRRCRDLSKIEAPVVKTAMYVRSAPDPCADALRERFGGELNIMPAGGHWVDIVSKKTDKGIALETIQKRLGILPSETIAFGDNDNDIGMLTRSGRGYAVANARDKVKAAADEVIGPMEEDSVLKVLKELL